MYLIFALIALDWLYLAWLKLLTICCNLRKALFPQHYNNNYGHEQVWMPPELWVELLRWMPPEQLVNCQQANARLRDIIDRHRVWMPRQIRQINYQAAAYATSLSFQIDNMLCCLLWILILCFNFGFTSHFVLLFLYTLPYLLLRLYIIIHDVDALTLKIVALLDTFWPRHSKLIVRFCERMGTFYEWISSNNLQFITRINFVLDFTTIIATLISISLAFGFGALFLPSLLFLVLMLFG